MLISPRFHVAAMYLGGVVATSVAVNLLQNTTYLVVTLSVADIIESKMMLLQPYFSCHSNLKSDIQMVWCVVFVCLTCCFVVYT